MIHLSNKQQITVILMNEAKLKVKQLEIKKFTQILKEFKMMKFNLTNLRETAKSIPFFELFLHSFIYFMHFSSK